MKVLFPADMVLDTVVFIDDIARWQGVLQPLWHTVVAQEAWFVGACRKAALPLQRFR